jgi:hypothetical protein
MAKDPTHDDVLRKTLKTPTKPFTPKKDKPKAGPKPPKARIQRHQGR